MSVVIRRAARPDVAALGVLGGHLMRAHHAFDPQRFLPPGTTIPRADTRGSWRRNWTNPM